MGNTLSAPSKIRLDQLLVDQGLAVSKTKAQAMIMAGSVKIDGSVVDKSGTMVLTDTKVELTTAAPYVSRGGEKLASVASELNLDFEGKTVLDVGASTGGFTDFALQNGAAKVITVDVGTGQLAWKLRNDPRIEVHEQIDIRHLEADIQADIALIDVSFISVLKIIDSVAEFVKPTGLIVAMVKPQFEAGKAVADKYHGVINNLAVRKEIIDKVRGELQANFEVLGEADSKVLGPRGNQERFMVLKPKR